MNRQNLTWCGVFEFLVVVLYSEIGVSDVRSCALSGSGGWDGKSQGLSIEEWNFGLRRGVEVGLVNRRLLTERVVIGYRWLLRRRVFLVGGMRYYLRGGHYVGEGRGVGLKKKMSFDYWLYKKRGVGDFEGHSLRESLLSKKGGL